MIENENNKIPTADKNGDAATPNPATEVPSAEGNDEKIIAPAATEPQKPDDEKVDDENIAVADENAQKPETSSAQSDEKPTAPKADASSQKSNKKKVPPRPKRQKTPLFLRAADPETVILVSILVGISAIIAFFLLASLTSLSDLHVALTVTVIYGLLAALILLRTRLTVRQYNEIRDSLVTDPSVMTELLRLSHVPVILTHDDSTVIWYNDAMRDALGIGDTHIIGKKLKKFCPINVSALLKATLKPSNPDRIAIAAKSVEDIKDNTNQYGISSGYSKTANGIGGIEYTIGNKRYIARAYTAKLPSSEKSGALRNYNLTFLEETTELFNLKDKIENENLVVAYVIIDNLSELAQYARIDYRGAANNIELHLKNWANEIGGVLCEYDRDKYMLLIHQNQLIQCIEENFPILKKIRAEQLGNSNMSVTISMGISGVGKTVAEREQNAQLALDTALRRGGDQIVIKKEKEFEFIGGRSKTAQIREKITSRTNAELLIDMIHRFPKVMIMGHKNPDCDSIGACIGMARFVRSKSMPDTNIRVIVDTKNETFLTCTAQLRELPGYKYMFIDGLDSIDILDENTLLIIVDANNFNIVEFPDALRSVEHIVIIDHHRKTVDFTRGIDLEYIDTSASSASELVTEMIESEMTGGELLNEEANVLLAGIMLDTMNFTRSAGVRTYAAAYYLRANGARAEEARTFFTEDISMHKAEAIFFDKNNLEFMNDTIAIAVSEGTGLPSYDRIAAAKAAERLIATKGIEAAFTLVKIGEAITISARSNGSVNVQKIAEKLHGGGHFDAAGAQVNTKSMTQVKQMLKTAINHYLEESKEL